MGFKVYTSQILYGLGRFLVITATGVRRKENDLIAESYLFGIDGGV